MSEQKNQDYDIENEIRLNRKFSMESAIWGEGGDYMSGGSPIPLVVQAQTTAKNWLRDNVNDIDGALLLTLYSMIDDEIVLFGQFHEEPLKALSVFLQNHSSGHELYDLVRRTDVKYGQLMRERPIFQNPGDAENPKDSYTHQSVSAQIKRLLIELV